VRLVRAEHGDRVGAVQLRTCALHGLEQVAVVEAVDQVRDDLGVGLAGEAVALGLQRRAQFVVVLDDAVVHERDCGRACGAPAGPVAEVRVRVCTAGAPCVAQRVWAMPVPPRSFLATCARVGDAVGAARALQASHRRRRRRSHSRGIPGAAALDEDGTMLRVEDRADDAAHEMPLDVGEDGL
jgi:hypothetical protein